MELGVDNFGPLNKVNVDFGPLTIIVGKNNIGKSYVAELYFTIMECSRRIIRSSLSRFSPRLAIEENMVPPPFEMDDEYHGFGRPLRGLRDQLAELSRRVNSEKLTDSSIVDALERLLLHELEQAMQLNLRLSLETRFGVRVNNLVNISAKNTRIRWDVLQHLSATAVLSRRGTVKVHLVLSKSERDRIEESLRRSKSLGFIRKARGRRVVYLARVYVDIMRSVLGSKEARASWPQKAYYIPAGRGGLLESYETVLRGLVSLSPLAPVRGLSMPPLPGMAAQFYSVLLRLEGTKGPLSGVVTQMFQEILQGDVKLRKVKDQPKFSLVYRFTKGGNSGSTYIIHAASMIKELAPIYLIVQELITPYDVLIIEEPESHLHPGAQLKFARIICRLVDCGVRVLITTHSDLLLRQIGHIAAQNLVQQEGSRLKPSDVVICLLKDGASGSTSERILLPRRGILEDLPTFDEVVKELYEEEQALERSLK
jgi:predicted ATPase